MTSLLRKLGLAERGAAEGRRTAALVQPPLTNAQAVEVRRPPDGLEKHIPNPGAAARRACRQCARTGNA
jgi:hypothetical protein